MHMKNSFALSSFFLLLLLLRGDQRHIKSSWKMDGGKSVQMERKPANDGVKGKPTKMGPGEREPLRAHQSPGKPSCLSAHVQGSISQEARCCDGEMEAECLGSRDGLGCPGNRWTGVHVSFAWWCFHLSTQFATSNTLTTSPTPYTYTKDTLKALWEEAKGKRERQSQQTRTPHCFLHHEPFCVWRVPKSQHVLRTKSFSKKLIIKTWSGSQTMRCFQIIPK